MNKLSISLLATVVVMSISACSNDPASLTSDETAVEVNNQAAPTSVETDVGENDQTSTTSDETAVKESERGSEGLRAWLAEQEQRALTSDETEVGNNDQKSLASDETAVIEADPASLAADEAAIREFLYRNAAATGAEDLEAVLQQISPACVSYDEAKEVFQMLFQAYDLQYEIEEVVNINVQGTTASVEIIQVTRKVAGPAFNDNRARVLHDLVKEDGEWKVCSSTMIHGENLD